MQTAEDSECTRDLLHVKMMKDDDLGSKLAAKLMPKVSQAVKFHFFVHIHTDLIT